MDAEPKDHRAPAGTGGTVLVLLLAAATFLVTGFLLLLILGALGAGVGPFELVLVALVAGALTWLFVRLGVARVRR